MFCEKHMVEYHTLCSFCMTEKLGKGVEVKDNVNNPSHYNQGGIECIDAIAEGVRGLSGMEAVCTGNAIKYLWRWKHKNGVEDLQKAKWYIERLIDGIDN